MPPPEIIRHIRSRGPAAYTWLRTSGWTAAHTERGDATVYADEMRGASLSVRRLQTSPLTLSPLAQPTGRVFFLLQIEGSTEVALKDGVNTTVGPSGFFACTHSDLANVSSDRPTARFEVIANMPLLNVRSLNTSPPPAWGVLVSLINTLFSSAITSRSPALPHIETSLQHALTGLLMESRGETAPGVSSSYLSLAHDAILRCAGNVDFNVERLATVVGITPRYLARVFRESGTSPSRALRAARVSRAQIALASGAGTRQDLRYVARSAGFPSERAMKDAFRQSGTRLTFEPRDQDRLDEA